MIDDRFINSTNELVKILKRLEDADDAETEELMFEELELDFWELMSWSRYTIETLNNAVFYKNKCRSTINETKDKLQLLVSKYPEDAETLDLAVKSTEAMQWTSKNSEDIHKKEKQKLWKKAIDTMYKECKKIAENDVITLDELTNVYIKNYGSK